MVKFSFLSLFILSVFHLGAYASLGTLESSHCDTQLDLFRQLDFERTRPIENIGPVPLLKETKRQITELIMRYQRLSYSARIQAKEMSFTEVKSLVHVVREVGPNVILAKVKEDLLYMKETGDEGNRLIQATNLSVDPPNEVFMFRLQLNRSIFFDSDIGEPKTGFQIKLADTLPVFIALLNRHSKWYKRTLGLIGSSVRYIQMFHTHPLQEFQLFADGKLEGAMQMPPSPEDLHAGAKLSKSIDVPLMMSVVTLNGTEYTAVFLKGENVTGKVDYLFQ